MKPRPSDRRRAPLPLDGIFTCRCNRSLLRRIRKIGLARGISPGQLVRSYFEALLDEAPDILDDVTTPTERNTDGETPDP